MRWSWESGKAKTARDHRSESCKVESCREKKERERKRDKESSGDLWKAPLNLQMSTNQHRLARNYLRPGKETMETIL